MVAVIIATNVIVTPAFCGTATARVPTTTAATSPHQPDTSHAAANTAPPAASTLLRPDGTTTGSPARVRRADGHHAATSSSAISASPITSAHRYSESNRKVSSMVPPAPAGTTHPCCHPSTTTGRSCVPSRCACHPGLVLSGTTSSRCAPASTVTTRRTGDHSVTAGDVDAGAETGSPFTSETASTVKASPGLTDTSCWPAGSTSRPSPHGRPTTGRPLRSSDAVARTDIRTT